MCSYSQTITKEELIGHWSTIEINYKIPKGIKKDELQQLMQLKSGFNNSSFEFRADGTFDFYLPLGEEMKIKNVKWSLIKGNKIIITENIPNSNHEIRETGALMIIYVKKIKGNFFLK